VSLAAKSKPLAGRTAALLAAREARVLSWALLARLIFLAIVCVLTALQTLELIPPGVIAQGPRDAAPMLAIEIGAVAAVAYLYRLARRREHLDKVGLGAVAVDITTLALVPVVWLDALPGIREYPMGLVKGELFSIAMLLIIINTITLVPLYPMLMMAGSILVLGTVTAYALSRPDVVLTDSYLTHFRSPALNFGILYIRALTMVLGGVFLSVLALTARRTIRQTVELEIANRELKERQAEMILTGRLAALDGMVAGIAHEINSPLGAVRSSVDTAEAAVRRLAPAAQATDPGAERIVALTGDVFAAARQGLARIGSLVEALRGFARLDEAAVQEADLHKELENVLSLIEPALIGNAVVERSFGAIPRITCRPRELNQVFMTLLVNAFEALKGEGRVKIRTQLTGDEVKITISDSGPGIPGDLAASIFDLRLTAKGERVGMGLGLPTSRRIVERHGGRLILNSPAQGAEFVITLPVEAPARD
jgi:signal transduction histidine kinase